MKRLILLLTIMMICIPLFAWTVIDKDNTLYSTDAGGISESSVMSINFSTGQDEISADGYKYSMGFTITPPSSQNHMPLISMMMLREKDGQVVPVEIDVPFVGLAIITTDDLQDGFYLKSISAIPYNGNMTALISCTEDYDYFLALLKRNNGKTPMFVKWNSSIGMEISYFELDYNHSDLEKLLYEVSIYNAGV